MSCVPAEVLLELGLAMQEGARKYGSHNYRVAGVRASVYYDAAMRHLMAWWEGEDIDPDSGLPNLVKAMACLAVIRDGVVTATWHDDRPIPLPVGWQSDLNKKASDLIDRWPNAKEPYVKKSNPLSTSRVDLTHYSTTCPTNFVPAQSPVRYPDYETWLAAQQTVDRDAEFMPPNGHGNDFQLGNTRYTATTCPPTYHSLGMKSNLSEASEALHDWSKAAAKGSPGQVTEVRSGDYLKWIGEQPVVERET